MSSNSGHSIRSTHSEYSEYRVRGSVDRDSAFSGRAYRFVLTIVLIGLSVLHAAPTIGQSAAMSTAWLASDGGVTAVELGTGHRLELPGTEGAVGLAVDVEGGSVWVVTRGALSRFFLDGTLMWRQKLDDPGSQAASLVLVPKDGSAWLARGDRLESFGAGGQALQRLDLASPSLGLSYDVGRSLLWVATTEGLTAHDPIGGVQVRSLDLGTEASNAAMRSVALDPRMGRICALAIDRLHCFDADGTRTVDQAVDFLAGSGALMSAHGDDLWLAGRSTLDRLDPSGAVTLSLSPFGEEGEILAWEVDPATRSLLISDGRVLSRISASGWELERLSLDEKGLGLRDLAVFSPTADTEPPTLEIVNPKTGSVVKTGRPRFEVRYQDDRSGVRSGSLMVSVNGSPSEAECSYRAEVATCMLDTLVDGSVELVVIVADEMGNISLPAAVLFQTETAAANREDAGSDDGTVSKAETVMSGFDQPIYTPVVTERGFTPNAPFQSASDIDHIDTSSGNLVVTVPLGQTYRVGPTLAYQVQPVYNSSLWQHIEVGCPAGGCSPPLEPITFASTNYAANAGMGWELHFGRLYPPISPSGLSGFNWRRWPNRPTDSADLNDRWMYVAPTGAVTWLHSLPGRNNGSASNPVRYSKDSSFIRMHQVSSNEVQVHMPNGLISVFKKTSQMRGTEFCGNGVSGCYRFHEMRDAYDNYMRVTYSLTGTTEKWAVRDSTGRQHTITFSHSDGNIAGNDCPNAQYCTDDGNEWGDLRKVVTKVDLAAFGSQTATYNFSYTTHTLRRSPPHEANKLPPGLNTIRVRLLDRITVPHSQSWRFKSDTTTNSHYNGRLIEVTAPSLGKIAWDYSNTQWLVPTRCTYQNVDPASIDWDYPTVGVRRRISKTSTGEVEGTWTYGSTLFPARSQLGLFGPGCSRANYRKTTVDGAKDEQGKYTRTVYYNSVAQGPRFPSANTSIDSWQITDGGLPFSKDFRTGSTRSTRRYLSKQIYHCSGSSCGSPKRSVWVRYATEYRNQCSHNFGDSAGCYQVNPLLVATKTRFHDDGSRYTDVENQQYNGAGNFRRTLTKDNFAGTQTRTDTTSYTATGTTTLGISSVTGYVNVGIPSSFLPGPSSRWLLYPYSKKTASESGRTYVTEFEFNSRGSLTCSRKWVDPGGRGSKDLVVKFGIGGSAGVDNGMPVSETVAGGEWGNLSDALCSTSGSASAGSKYVLSHAYQHLELKSSQIAGFPNLYRADIDRDTGLASRTYNPADQSTSHSYDELGRLTSSTPASSIGAATTEIVYRNPSIGNPSMTTSLKSTSGSILSHEIQVYDHFARPNRHILRRPAGTASHTETEQKTFYNALSWVTKVTTRQNKSGVDSDLAARYLNYDAFGRPGRLIAADGQEETRTYDGIRKLHSTRQVRTSTEGTSAVKTTTVSDVRQRVTHVINPLYSTKFTYDPYDQRVSAQRTGSGIDQTRFYGYDARGLLLSEQHPEIGGSGNGEVIYKPDAFGNRRRLTDDGRDLTYVYDNAGRLLQIKNTSDGKRWRDWTWGDSNSGSDYRKGKVVREVRHNYPGGGSFDWAIHEEYEYRGKLGQVSEKTTQLQFPGNSGDDRFDVFFSQSFAYDQLGNPTSYGYPECQTTPQNGRRQCDDGPNDALAPNHSVAVSYNQGLTRKVTSSLGVWGEYSYHHNLQLARIDYSNNVDGIFDQGTHGMVRPQRVHYKFGAATRYDSGDFGYDGAGNIWQVGADRYVYDQASRLLSGTVSHAGIGRQEEYTYDTADNILSSRRDGGFWVNRQVSSSTNRMSGAVGYDGAGNMTTIGSPPVYTMQYDELNQQVQFDNTLPGQESIHLYAFGAGEYRLITFDGHTAERTFKFRDLEGRVLREYKVNGWGDYGGSGSPGAAWVFEKDYIYGANGLIATRERDGTRHFFHQDHLGSARAITDSAGTVRGQRHYYPFGTAVATSSGVDEPTVKFTGHERDPHNLTDYMLARTYLFPFGRFASVDPARDGWNLYAYVGNNPINGVDPDGRAVDLIVDGGFILFDLGDIATSLIAGEGVSGTQLLALGGDVLGAAVPFLTGVGAAVRAGAKADKVVDAAKAVDAASAAQSARPRPGAAGSLQVGDDVFTAASVKGQNSPRLDPRVQKVLDDIPAGQRSRTHGRCVEPQCISQALGKGVDPRGGVSTVLRVKPPGNPKHLTPLSACPSCRILLEKFGILDGVN